jgi:hypothetical protein
MEWDGNGKSGRCMRGLKGRVSEHKWRGRESVSHAGR